MIDATVVFFLDGGLGVSVADLRRGARGDINFQDFLEADAIAEIRVVIPEMYARERLHRVAPCHQPRSGPDSGSTRRRMVLWQEILAKAYPVWPQKSEAPARALRKRTRTLSEQGKERDLGSCKRPKTEFTKRNSNAQLSGLQQILWREVAGDLPPHGRGKPRPYKLEKRGGRAEARPLQDHTREKAQRCCAPTKDKKKNGS